MKTYISISQVFTKHLVILSFISLAFVQKVKSQNTDFIDSLLAYVDTAGINTPHVQNLLNIGYNYTYSTPQKAEPFLMRADSISRLLPENNRMNGVIQLYFGILYLELSRYDDALEHTDQAIDLFEQEDIKQYQAISIHHKAKIHFATNRWDLSHESNTKAGELFEELGDKSNMAQVQLSLGNVNYRLGNKAESLNYFKRAREICAENPSTNCWQVATGNMVTIYIEQREEEKALILLNELEAFQRDNNDLKGLSNTYYKQAELWDEIYRDDVKSAEYSKKSLDIRLELGNELDIVKSKLDYGRNLVRLKDYRSAKTHLTEGLRIAEKLEDINMISTAHRSLAQLYDSIGDYKKAYENLRIHKTLKDTINNKDVLEKVANLETKFQTEKKEKEIAILESEQKLAQQTISSQRRLNIISVIGGSLMALLSVFLFRLFKQNQTQKIQLAQSVKDKDYLLREIHHRVKNNLQVISSLLYLQSEKLTDTAAQDAINVGRGRVKSMALIHQNLYGVNQSSEINLKKYLEDLAEELFDSYNLRGEDISLSLDIETAVVDVDLLVPLGLILNELISNALKYAFEGREKGVLSISAKKQNETIHVRVKDDGVGIDPSDIEKDSFGTELIQSFAEQLEAKIETIVDDGTEVNLLIPLNVGL